ncbi:hypothetical protein JAAARDRAFT_84093, partial [Jaapia argillacea MUCL 33604]
YWGSHLSQLNHNQMIDFKVNLLDFFIRGGVLYWIEVLSLFGQLRVALESMHFLTNSIGVSNKEVSMWANDVYRFLLAFYQPIAASTPHIYVSGIPFAPIETNLVKTYLRSFSNMYQILQAPHSFWKQELQTLKEHKYTVSCIAISYDGKYIVSGSYDKTIRIWDAVSGAPVLQPLEGHTDWVTSVAFSPDGQRIVSGSVSGSYDKTIRIWDAVAGAPVLQPLEGHTDWVTSVAFSPDGQRIVSGSDNKTVRIWDAVSGAPVLQPLKGHTEEVTSVACSPDG